MPMRQVGNDRKARAPRLRRDQIRLFWLELTPHALSPTSGFDLEASMFFQANPSSSEAATTMEGDRFERITKPYGGDLMHICARWRNCRVKSDRFGDMTA
ncbi:hypothetical protein Q1695_006821 [Nippostrongylus brasiliensis]|nr:hypothetical protein Q1695_006821 [Nippostrongylus brasiliensis]